MHYRRNTGYITDVYIEIASCRVDERVRIGFSRVVIVRIRKRASKVSDRASNGLRFFTTSELRQKIVIRTYY